MLQKTQNEKISAQSVYEFIARPYLLIKNDGYTACPAKAGDDTEWTDAKESFILLSRIKMDNSGGRYTLLLLK